MKEIECPSQLCLPLLYIVDITLFVEYTLHPGLLRSFLREHYDTREFPAIS
jgi:hypothetical protein